MELNNNKIINKPKKFDANVNFVGKNNILYFEDENTKVIRSSFTFKGNNSIVIIKSTNANCMLNCLLYNDSLIYVGSQINMNNTLSIIASESKNVFIGDDCLFSSSVVIRTGDAHRIYSCETLERINLGKSVYIGDHVWVAARSVILKGTQIHSGSIIGCDSVVGGQTAVRSNEIWAGIPAKLLKTNVFYDKKGSHGISSSDFNRSLLATQKQKEAYTYAPDKNSIPFDKIEETISKSTDKTKSILNLLKNNSKNRFAL